MSRFFDFFRCFLLKIIFESTFLWLCWPLEKRKCDKSQLSRLSSRKNSTKWSLKSWKFLLKVKAPGLLKIKFNSSQVKSMSTQGLQKKNCLTQETQEGEFSFLQTSLKKFPGVWKCREERFFSRKVAHFLKIWRGWLNVRSQSELSEMICDNFVS